MTCNLHVEDFAIGGLHDPTNGLCRTPGCPHLSVGLHPNRAGMNFCLLTTNFPFIHLNNIDLKMYRQ